MFISFKQLSDLISESLLKEFVKQIPGHKNSNDEDAPWCVVSHETGKVISSHKTKKEAEEHLKHMHIFKK